METLREKTSGKISIDGFDLDHDASSIKKVIGVQLQSSGFYPGLNLIELIRLFGGLYNKTVDPMALLEKVNLKDKAKNKINRISAVQSRTHSTS
jgi:ABC-2 type transport system ATP-binding protein